MLDTQEQERFNMKKDKFFTIPFNYLSIHQISSNYISTKIASFSKKYSRYL